MEGEEAFYKEYKAALEYISSKHPDMHPSEKRRVARRIAEKKVGQRREPYFDEFTLEDLAIW
ncbi:MAG: hypothetical protein QXN57_03240 [Desulfurococcaceae archaeon]